LIKDKGKTVKHVQVQSANQWKMLLCSYDIVNNIIHLKYSKSNINSLVIKMGLE